MREDEGSVSVSSGGLTGLEVTNGKCHSRGGRSFDSSLPDLQSPLVEGGPLNIAALTTSDPVSTVVSGLDRAILCARVAEENKAKDVVILDMRGITPLFDFQVL